MKIETTVEITDERLRDLIITGVEGGFGSWIQYETYKHSADNIDDILVQGRENLEEDEGPGEYGPWVKLDKARFEWAMKEFAKQCPHQFNLFLNENEDAITGDCFMQIAVLGEVTYA